MNRKKSSPGRSPRSSPPVDKPLRIIGGTLRNSPLRYTGDPRTRPMKERVREAVFNLVGPSVKGTHAVDLFAGTGALGLEAISRGAARATFVERHFPTTRLIKENIAALGVADRCEVIGGDAFLWPRRQRDAAAGDPIPWLVLCSPPFEFYVQRREQMHALLLEVRQRCPAGSILVVEADQRFDFEILADLGTWDVRPYPPAVVGILRVHQERQQT
jgi:16S rRNA (guanine966-N2)-methyltransferase